MKIEVNKPQGDSLESRGVLSWPTWEKDISRFDWHYEGRPMGKTIGSMLGRKDLEV